MANLLGQKLTRHPAVNPVFRNSNIAGAYDKDKLGWTPFLPISWGTSPLVYGYPEGINGSLNPTNYLGFYRSIDRGMSWQAVPGYTQPVLTPLISPSWENGELCFTGYLKVNGVWYFYFNGGNNGTTRRVGVMTTTDPTDPTKFQRYASNPVLGVSAGPATDDSWVADFTPITLPDGTYWATYRGVETATGIQRTHFCTATNPLGPWAKGGVLIACGTTGQFDFKGTVGATHFLDANGRLHIYYVGEPTTPGNAGGGVGYGYSDPPYTTFNKGANNPIWAGTGVTTDFDSSVTDGTGMLLDSDTIFVRGGGTNLSGALPAYNGSTRFEGCNQAWEFIPTESPTLGGRGYRTWPSIAAGSQQSSLTAAQVMNLFNSSLACIYGEFKVPKERSTLKTIFEQGQTGAGGSRRDIVIAIDSAGKFQFQWRADNGTSVVLNVVINGTNTYDDNKRRWFLARRTGASTFDIYVGDESGSTLEGSASGTTPLLQTPATYQAVWGNTLNQANPFAPMNGSLCGCMVVKDGVITPADALAYFNSRSGTRVVPTPSAGSLYRWQMGLSATSTETELGGSGIDLTHTNSPTRVEWTTPTGLDLSAPASTAVGRHIRRSIAARRRHAA